MSSTYTANDGIEKMATGDQSNNWGATLDNNFDLIDQSLDGVVSIALSSNTFTLNVAPGSLSNGRNRVIIFTGTPTGTVTVTISPANLQKVYWIENQSSRSVVLSNGSGTTLTIPTGTTAPAFCDGVGNVTGLQAGNNSFTSLNVTGNETIGGTLVVAGATTLAAATVSSLNIGAQTLTAFINALIPSLSALTGPLVISSISVVAVTNGSYLVLTFGGTAGTRTQIAIGTGTAGNGNTIPVPAGFSGTNQLSHVGLGTLSVTPSNQLDNINVTTSGAVVTATASDNSGHNFTVVANWVSICWATNV